MDDIDILEKNMDKYEYIITTVVADELDRHKESDSQRIAYCGRTALKFIEKHENDLTFVINDIIKELPLPCDLTQNDNKIVATAFENGYFLSTRDRGMLIKAKALGIPTLAFKDEFGKEVNFLGYKKFYISSTDLDVQTRLAKFEESSVGNPFELDINQFAVIYNPEVEKNADKPIYVLQWNGKETVRLKLRDKLDNAFFKDIKPRNLEQKMLFSLMQDEGIKIKLASGGYGTGKDYCMLLNCFDMILNHKYDRLVWLRPPIQIKGIPDVGFLKGSLEEKLAPYSMILEDILGGDQSVDYFKRSGKLAIEHLGFIRGRTYKNSILYLTECQNLSVEAIQLVISRLGEGSILVLNGDFSQIDETKHTYSSIKRVIEILSDRKEFGYIFLDKVERSSTADLARLFG